MKLAEHSIILNATREHAWRKLVDWQRMPEWDIFMKSVHFDGPLQVGSVGRLVVKNNQEFTLRVTQLQPLKDYTDEFRAFGMHFVFYHRLKELSPNQVEMYFSIECNGPLSWLVSLGRKKQHSDLAQLMTNFKNQLESTA